MFRDPEELKTDMDKLLDELNHAQPAEGCERVYYAGQKEHESEQRCARLGIPLTEKNRHPAAVHWSGCGSWISRSDAETLSWLSSLASRNVDANLHQ